MENRDSTVADSDQLPASPSPQSLDSSDLADRDSNQGTAPPKVPTDDQTQPKPSPPSHPIRNAMLVALLLFGVLNWPYAYSVASQTSQGAIDAVMDFSAMPGNPPKMGGWPFRYLISIPPRGDAIGFRVFSILSLGLNVLIFALASLALALYLFRRSKRASAKQVSIADLLAGTLLLAIAFTLWQGIVKTHERHIELANLIANSQGASSSQSWVPSIAEEYLPTSVTKRLERLRAIRIETPSSDLMESIVDVKTIGVLRVGGGDYDIRLLDRLHQNPTISDLRVAGRKIDVQTFQSLCAHRNIQTLNVMKTNVTAEALEFLDRAQHLKRIGVMQSDVRCSRIQTSEWTNRVKEAWFSRHADGVSDSLLIDGWPKLERVRIDHFNAANNADAMPVTIRNAVELQSIKLDIHQNFALNLDNLPKLTEIKTDDFKWQFRLASGENKRGGTWLSKLILKDLPSLTGDFSFYACDLEQLSITGCPRITTLGPLTFGVKADDELVVTPLKSQPAQALIDGLAVSSGPKRVDMNKVLLTETNFASLKQNSGIEDLLLSNSDTTITQWKDLEGMSSLKRLDLNGCKMDNGAVTWLLDHLPSLEHLSVAPSRSVFNSHVRTLEIIDRPNLRSLDMGEIASAFYRSVRIVNSPNLEMKLNLGFTEELTIKNSPRIAELIINAPNLRKVDIDSLPYLTAFAAGGPQCNDEILSPLTGSRLQTLTLAYPSVTAEGLKQIKQLNTLKQLCVPGSALDDAVVKTWPSLNQLTHLDVSDTNITGVSLKKLLASNSLAVVRLDRSTATAGELASLAQQQQLQSISLAGVVISPATLEGLSLLPSLQRLDLSNTKVDAEMLGALASNAAGLQHLALRECEVESRALMALARRHHSLTFDLTGSDAMTAVQTHLLSNGRIATVKEFDQRQYFQQRMNNRSATMGGVMMGMEPVGWELVNVDGFRQLRQRATRTKMNQSE